MLTHLLHELACIEMRGTGGPGMRGLRGDDVVTAISQIECATRIVNDEIHTRISERVADAERRHLLVGADHFRFQFDHVDASDGCRHFLNHAAAAQSDH